MDKRNNSLVRVFYRVMCVSDVGTKFVFCSGLSYVEAFYMCNDDYAWVWQDDNGVVWNLQIEADR